MPDPPGTVDFSKFNDPQSPAHTARERLTVHSIEPACAGCHSPNGAGIPAQFPRLSGQHAEYTATQLRGFRSGERGNNAVMMGVASRMNDKEIAAVSDYIAELR